jgi:hypothetical protein
MQGHGWHEGMWKAVLSHQTDCKWIADFATSKGDFTQNRWMSANATLQLLDDLRASCVSAESGMGPGLTDWEISEFRVLPDIDWAE